MNHSGFNGALATGLAVDVQVSPAPRQSPGNPALERELDLKLAALQKDYADLHAALFEAAQAHRRLCAPRLVRRGDFEIASEIFAVRYLPGDFFTVEETSSGLLLALGDICGHGLAAGMLLRADGQLELLSIGGPLVGVLPEASFARGSVELRAGDLLLAYSDGIIESRDNSDQEFGYERLKAELLRARTGSADAALFSVLGAVQDFAAERKQADDMSLVVIRRRAS